MCLFSGSILDLNKIFRRRLLKLMMVVLVFCSCTPDYEKAIAEWTQTDENGTWTDLKFKILKVYNTRDLVVADSIRLLRNRFEKDKEKAISAYKHDIKVHGTYLQFAEYAGSADQVQKTIEKLEIARKGLEESQSVEFHSTYDDRDTTEVLGTYLRCRYSFFSSRLNTEQEEDGIFLLTPDMKRCLGSVSNKFYEQSRNKWKEW